MNWYKYSQSIKIPKTLYHATFLANLKNIKTNGIIPSNQPMKCWNCRDGVYMHADPDVAVSYVEVSDNTDIPEEWFEKIIALEIDTSLLNVNLFDLDPEISPPDNEQSFIYSGVVPYNAIKRVL